MLDLVEVRRRDVQLLCKLRLAYGSSRTYFHEVRASAVLPDLSALFEAGLLVEEIP